MADINALRSLYLAVGIQDRGASATLDKLQARASKLEATLLRVAAAAAQVGRMNIGAGGAAVAGTGATRFTRASNRPAIVDAAAAEAVRWENNVVRHERAAIARAASNERAYQKYLKEVNGPKGGRYGPTGMGIGTATFLSTTLAYGAISLVSGGADFERQSRLAAGSGGRDQAQIEEEAISRARRYNLRLAESIKLSREVEQLGVGDAFGANAIAEASSAFHVLNQEVEASEVASGIYRLMLSTSTTEGELMNAQGRAMQFASAIQVIGDKSSAGAAQVFDMMQNIQAIGQLSAMTAPQIIALSGALAHMNPEGREMFRTALQRMVVTGTLNVDDPMASLLGIGENLRNLSSQGKLDYLEKMGLGKGDSQRNITTLLTLASAFENLKDGLAAANEEMDKPNGQTALFKRSGEALSDLKGHFDAFRTSLDNFGAMITETIGPAIKVLFTGLTGLVDLVSSSRFLTMLTVIGGGFVGGKIAGSFLSRFTGGLGLMGMLRGGGAVAGAGALAAGGTAAASSGWLARLGLGGASAAKVGGKSLFGRLLPWLGVAMGAAEIGADIKTASSGTNPFGQRSMLSSAVSYGLTGAALGAVLAPMTAGISVAVGAGAGAALGALVGIIGSLTAKSQPLAAAQAPTRGASTIINANLNIGSAASAQNGLVRIFDRAATTSSAGLYSTGAFS